MIKIIGVGGCGGNIVDRLLKIDKSFKGSKKVKFVVVNKDVEGLKKSLAGTKVKASQPLNKADEKKLKKLLVNTKTVILLSGFGGYTGTKVTPVVARLSKEKNITTIVIIAKPFSKLDSKDRTEQYEVGIKEVEKYADVLLVVSNDLFIKKYPKGNLFYVLDKIADDFVYNFVVNIIKKGY